MPKQETGNIIPRTKADVVAFAKNIALVVAILGASFTGTAAANESRIDRIEQRVERIEYRIERVLDALEEHAEGRQP
jgi:hypothetical protein